jgi:phosphocarrier protein HPr
MGNEFRLIVKHPSGLHARPASVFVQVANKFKADIQVMNLTSKKGPVNAKSILSVLTLGVSEGFEIKLIADGPDASLAIKTLEELVNSNFEREIG